MCVAGQEHLYKHEPVLPSSQLSRCLNIDFEDNVHIISGGKKINNLINTGFLFIVLCGKTTFNSGSCSID